ncbi:MAG: cytochrome c biogenesis protein CcsA [Geothrix sp.]|uniref:cytochrome c biogenesis protein n=1 Tax=Geothrix sp. TaxID=1962974 RepID=UPI00184D7150|nr:cytochrome c biogenesis protein CcsA [Geothrix sp.]NWJ42533.1 cytochrome c biogenesis protein CcsA [Geothrix sp.]WIL19506.1 MAG: cytochrome c biogenesis protein CcsA [Geothrix sp.]
MAFVQKYLAWGAGVLALLIALVVALPTGKARGFDVGGFGNLPILEGGRVKPLDSLARNSLLVIHSRQGFRHDGRMVGPDEWILDVLFRPQVADQQAIFVIDDPEVISLIGAKQTKNRNYFSFADLSSHLDEVQKQAASAQPISAQKRTRFQSAIVNLFDRVYLYYKLRNTLQLAGSPGLGWELQSLGTPEAALRHQDLTQLAHFRMLPPATAANPDAWQSVGQALSAVNAGAGVHPALVPLAKMNAAYVADDAASFNAALAEMNGVVTTLKPDALGHASNELLFNRAQPFFVGLSIYFAAFIVLCISWIYKPELLRPTAYALLVSAAIVHTIGLFARIILQGRPPVTNLYSSAVFVGWAAVILGIIVERMYRKGFGTAVAAVAGFATLIVAQNLGEGGDTMEMMRAVLDSNFWLATHVTTITIGYSGTFLAGAIAIAYALKKHIAPKVDVETDKALADMAYGIICFALFFSFVGTVLGGIWADQSWGRFWGWDPKENGALLIVLWNAIILHARMAGYVRERGIMVMAIFGNVITAASWFGVNLLGVGLHAYGFTDSGFIWLVGFWVTQLIFMGLCYAPARFWAQKPPANA